MALFDLFDDMFEPAYYSLIPRRTVPLRILSLPSQNQGAVQPEDQSGTVATQSHWSETVPLGGGFEPSDVSVKYGDKSVTVNAKKQHHQQDRRGEVYSLMETTRTVDVPEDVDPKSVKAFLTPHGEIKLIAPSPAKRDEPMETEGSDTWKLNLNLEGFKPEELDVKIKGNLLTVNAEQKDEGDGHQWHRRITRVVTVPTNVDADQLQSVRTEGGVLKLTAPYKKPEQLTPPERVLSIEHEKKSDK